MEEARKRRSPCLDYSKIISQTKHFSTETKATGTLADLPPPNLRPQLLLLLLSLLLLFSLRHKCRTHVNRDILCLFFLALLSLGCQFAIATGIGGIFYSTFSQLLLSVVVVVSLVPDCSHISTNTFHRYLAPQRRLLLSRTALSFLMPTAFSRISARFMACQETRHDSQTYTHAHAQRQMAAGHWAKMKTLLTGSWRKRTEKVIHPAKRPL